MATTLPLYWNLSSADTAERLSSSSKLIDSLLRFQQDFAPHGPSDESSDSEVEGRKDDSGNLDELKSADRHLESLNAEDVQYALKRLVRGLASSRDSSRIGFAVALSELLQRLETVTATQICELVMSSSESSGAMKGYEQRDQHFARLFGFLAIVRSGILFRSIRPGVATSSRTSLNTGIDDFKLIVTELLVLGDKKSWIKESCWWTVMQALVSLVNNQPSWINEAHEWILKEVFKTEHVWGPEKLAFAIYLQQRIPSADWRRLVCPPLKDEHILDRKNLSVVSRILRDAPAEEQEGGKQSAAGSWKPELHFVWKLIISMYLPTAGSALVNQTTPSSSFDDFYRVAVDETLFAASATPERKAHGFAVVELAMSSLPPERVPLLFTQNMMRTWINQLSGKDRTLHQAARQLVSRSCSPPMVDSLNCLKAQHLSSFAELHPMTGFSLVIQLMGKHGSKDFDKITGSKTIQSILEKMDDEGLSQYLEFVKEQLLAPPTSPKFKDDASMLWAVEQLNTLIRRKASAAPPEWTLAALDTLIVVGFTEQPVRTSENGRSSAASVEPAAYSPALRKRCRSVFFGVLGTLITTGDKIAHSKPSETSWLLKCSAAVDMRTGTGTRTESRGDGDDVVAEATSLAIKLSKLQSSDSTLMGLQELVLGVLLLQRDPECPQSDVLKNIVSASGKIMRLKKNITKSKKSLSDRRDEDDTRPVDEILDVIIGLLEGTNTSDAGDSAVGYSRALANHAFGHLCFEMDNASLQFILQQLDPHASEDQGSADEDSSEDDQDDISGTGDLNMESSEESAGSLSEDDSESESDGSEESSEAETGDEDGDDEEAMLEFRRKISAALGNGDAGNDGSGDEEEVLLGDEEMFKVDEQLAAVFKLQQGPSTRRKDRAGQKRKATHFKNRVVDLLDIYVRKCPESPHIPGLVPPLIHSIREGKNKDEQYTQKVLNLVDTRIGRLKTVPNAQSVTPLQRAALQESLITLHQLAQHQAKLLPQHAMIYLSKVMSSLSSDLAQETASLYRESLKDFATRKSSQVPPSLFVQWIRSQPAVAWTLRADILVAWSGPDTLNLFRRLQILQLVEELARSISSEESVPAFDKRDYLNSVVLTSVDQMERSADDGSAKKLDMSIAQLKQVARAVAQSKRLMQKHTAQGDSDHVADNKINAIISVLRQRDAQRFSGVVSILKPFESIGANGKSLKTNGLPPGAARPDGNEKTPSSPSVVNGTESGPILKRKLAKAASHGKSSLDERSPRKRRKDGKVGLKA